MCCLPTVCYGNTNSFDRCVTGNVNDCSFSFNDHIIPSLKETNN